MDDLFKKLERNNNLRSQILKSFISGVMTDDERAVVWNLPKGCRMRENAKIISPEKFKCGEYVWIGEGAIIDASGGLEIGDHTSIGLYVMVWSHTSFLANLTFNNVIGNPLIARAKTKIGKGCFIAGHSVIYHGVTIGDRTIVMPMSVITKDIPGNCIVGGSPAKVIKEIDDDFIEEQINKLKDAGQI
jgi:acetyltransferase-like isoleucine patch superfamily enzyme